MGLTQVEWWRENYRKNRYMEHLSSEELAQRFKDVMRNLFDLTNDGQLGAVIEQSAVLFWKQMLTYINEEYEFRGGMPKDIVDDIKIPQPTFPNRPVPDEILKVIDLASDNHSCLIKVGKYQHLNDLYENGRLYLNPASYFIEPSLNLARNDDETRIKVEIPGSEVKVRKHPDNTPIDIIGNFKVTMELKTDYYVYCMSQSLAIRYFEDFDADAILCIHKPDEFCYQILYSIMHKLDTRGFSWDAYGSAVQYIDPLKPPDKEPDVFCTKHFRYWYQNEYRLLWIPHVSSQKLYPEEFDVGDVKQYCDIFTL